MINNIIYNEDCLITLDKLDEKSIDAILTSPPYNMTKRKGGYADTGRYDVYQDWKTEEEYINWMVLIFNKIDNVLKDNGVIIFNINYSIENPILPNSIVYDPFMGNGTTAVACKQMNLNYIGSEISSEQCKYAKERIEKINISNDESDEQL